jgi:TolA-binding protein
VPDPSIDETPSTPARTELIAQLARFEPPAYLPVTLRGVETTASVQTAAAMERYRAGDFAEAAEGLRGVLAAGPPTPAAAFYLGICELQAGRAPEAASLFHRALAIDDGIFEEDAKFFLSKALLLQDDVSGAAATLKEVVALAGDREAEARNLLEAIGRLPRS